MKINLMTNENRVKENHQVFRFETDAQRFKISFKIKNRKTKYYPHVGLAAQEGLTLLYRDKKDESWYNLDCVTERFDSTFFMNHLIEVGKEYEILIYGPILNKIDQIEVESFDGHVLKNIKSSPILNILICGGLQSHGMGCTTPSLTFPNILERKLKSASDYITFDDKDYYDKLYAVLKEINITKKYDFGLLEVDYSNQDDNLVKHHLQNVLKLMKTKCNQIICWSAIPEYKHYKKSIAYKLVKELDEKGINWADCSIVHDIDYADIYTYSGNFINDSGNILIANILEKRIRSLSNGIFTKY